MDTNKTIEERFIKWAEARDDDWWEDQARIDIWDFRIMLDFFKDELAEAEKKGREEAVNEVWVTIMKADLESPFTLPANDMERLRLLLIKHFNLKKVPDTKKDYKDLTDAEKTPILKKITQEVNAEQKAMMDTQIKECTWGDKCPESNGGICLMRSHEEPQEPKDHSEDKLVKTDSKPQPLEWEEAKQHFEQNMLDGDRVEDGGNMLSAESVWEYIQEVLSQQRDAMVEKSSMRFKQCKKTQSGKHKVIFTDGKQTWTEDYIELGMGTYNPTRWVMGLTRKCAGCGLILDEE